MKLNSIETEPTHEQLGADKEFSTNTDEKLLSYRLGATEQAMLL